VLVALIIGGVAVQRLNGVFPRTPACPSPIPAMRPPPYAAKTAIYEILGPPGTTGRRQLDGCGVTTAEGQLHPRCRGRRRSSPRCPAIFAYVIAQGDGPSIGCRITVDGKLVDQQQVNTRGRAGFPAWTNPREPTKTSDTERTKSPSRKRIEVERKPRLGAPPSGVLSLPIVVVWLLIAVGVNVFVPQLEKVAEEVSVPLSPSDAAFGDRDEAHREEVQGVRL